MLNLSPSPPRGVAWDMVPAAVCAARERACGRVLCWERGGADGAAGAGRLVPLRLVAANDVRLYPIEDDSSEMDS